MAARNGESLVWTEICLGDNVGDEGRTPVHGAGGVIYGFVFVLGTRSVWVGSGGIALQFVEQIRLPRVSRTRLGIIILEPGLIRALAVIGPCQVFLLRDIDDARGADVVDIFLLLFPFPRRPSAGTPGPASRSGYRPLTPVPGAFCRSS